MTTPKILVDLDSRSWQAGYDAGFQGLPGWPVPAGLDGLSWSSGYIEGEADRVRPERVLEARGKL